MLNLNYLKVINSFKSRITLKFDLGMIEQRINLRIEISDLGSKFYSSIVKYGSGFFRPKKLLNWIFCLDSLELEIIKKSFVVFFHFSFFSGAKFWLREVCARYQSQGRFVNFKSTCKFESFKV